MHALGEQILEKTSENLIMGSILCLEHLAESLVSFSFMSLYPVLTEYFPVLMMRKQIFVAVNGANHKQST